MSIGSSATRVDAYEKVTGQAKYTDDLTPRGALVAKVVHSTIANGVVKAINTEKASAVPGVIKIITCFDVPDIQFPTAGHPWSVEPAHQDVADRKLLNRRVRIYGDDIAAIVAEDNVSAQRAERLLEIEYEEYPAYITPEQAMAEGAVSIHEEKPNNIIAHSKWKNGEQSFDDAVKGENVKIIEQHFALSAVQHCHIEPPISFAYMENDRIIVVSSTQIPHIMRRVIAQALGISFGKIKVIKPYIGGGFGNKQDVLYEPLNAYLTMQVGGRCVKLEISREETFFATRTRHAVDFDVKTAVRPDGRLIARKLRAVSNQGGYASHAHAIVANSVNEFRHLYQEEKMMECDALTVYTNIATGGAMRGYGIPQASFAQESHMDDIALALGLDPIELRLKNCMKKGYKDPGNGIACHSTGLEECIRKGRDYIGWDKKREEYKNDTGNVRRGVGMAIFSYKTGVYPISLETASARMVLNQDGSASVIMGATEIGQGADTVFMQIAAECSGIPESMIHIVSQQDTDQTPFDTGAYASRQSYVSGTALKKCAEQLKQNILDYAKYLTNREPYTMDIIDGQIVHKGSGDIIMPLSQLAMESFYSLKYSRHLTAEVTHHCTDNTYSFGATFADIEVDIPLGKIFIKDIINIHDSGVLINPKLAEAQVHGGMSMGLGYALSEALLFDDKARLLNDNLLDYKLPTSMDTPELNVDFVQTVDPSGPFGNKSLGEPPAISPAGAIRNALLHATGVAVNSLPLSPQKLCEHFAAAGLIKQGGRLMYDINSIFMAGSVDEAIKALCENSSAVIISGGTDVLIKIREGKLAGSSLVSIHDLSELKGVSLLPDKTVKIGPAESFTHISKNDIILKTIPVLAHAVGQVGGPQIRNTGTVGGNICNGVTSADSASTLMVLDAELELTGENGTRIVPISQFYTGPGKTVRGHTEIMTAIYIRPESYEGFGAHYIKYAQRSAMDIATLGCAVNVKLSADKGVIEDARIAFGVAAPTPVRCPLAEAALCGKHISAQLFIQAAELALTEVSPRTSWRASKEFRLGLVKELTQRVAREAVINAGGVLDA